MLEKYGRTIFILIVIIVIIVIIIIFISNSLQHILVSANHCIIQLLNIGHLI